VFFLDEHSVALLRETNTPSRRLGNAEPTRFQELIVRHSASPMTVDAAAFEIVLATGEVVRVPSSFDAAALARLLDVLSRSRACCISRRACSYSSRRSRGRAQGAGQPHGARPGRVRHDPLSDHPFVFFSKRCDRVRIV